MNGKVADAAKELVERAYLAGVDKEFREDLRVVLDALLQPAKPEAVRLRDELRERANEDRLIDELRDVEDYFNDVDPNPIHLATVQAAIDALAATGKQQVGEVQGDARSQFEAWVESRLQYGLHKNPDGTYNWITVQEHWEGWQAALAARQPVGQNHLRKAIATVCEGWTLPADARKILEKAMWEYTPPAETNGDAAQ